MTKDRVIYHIDCNGFYAAVECLDNPALKEIPMAVAGDPKDRSGIILAKNELAKKCGVKTETIYQARRKCPELYLVPPRHDRYVQVSRQVKGLFADYTDQVESFGLDEAWLDVTGSLRYFKAAPRELADRIRCRVRDEIGITVSVGVSFNKVFAKLGSDLKKPDATTVISRDNYRRLVWPLGVGELLFVGKNAVELLRKHSILTIGDAAQCDPAWLTGLMGKGGETLWQYANGLEDSPVRRIGEREPVKSVGNGMTFRRDLVGWDELRAGAAALSDEVAARLRSEQMKCRAVQIMVKNPQLKSISRQMQLDTPTHLQKEIMDAVMRLLYTHWRENAPVRALTITGIQLVSDQQASEQLSLWDDGMKRDKLERAEAAMRQLRQKHGNASISMGFLQHEELGIRPYSAETEEEGDERRNTGE